MKKVLLLLLLGELAGGLSVWMWNNVHSDRLYPEMGIVTDIMENINSDENIITVTVGNGNQFTFYDDSEDWFVNDLCGMIMDNKGTKTVYDDEVISTKYVGYLDLFEEREEN